MSYMTLGERVQCTECGAPDVSVNCGWTLRSHTSWRWSSGPVRGIKCSGPSEDEVFRAALHRHQLTPRQWHLQQQGRHINE